VLILDDEVNIPIIIHLTIPPLHVPMTNIYILEYMPIVHKGGIECWVVMNMSTLYLHSFGKTPSTNTSIQALGAQMIFFCLREFHSHKWLVFNRFLFPARFRWILFLCFFHDIFLIHLQHEAPVLWLVLYDFVSQ